MMGSVGIWNKTFIKILKHKLIYTFTVIYTIIYNECKCFSRSYVFVNILGAPSPKWLSKVKTVVKLLFLVLFLNSCSSGKKVSLDEYNFIMSVYTK